MRRSIVKAKLVRDEPVLLTHLHSLDPTIYELVGLMGFDGIWMDLEHSPKSVETAAMLMRAARVGNTDVMARPGRGELMRLQRLLEAGAMGIMYPRCQDEVEAADVVRHAKFAPMGIRGVDGGNADQPFGSMSLGDYTRMANDETFVVVQLEEQAAIDRAHEIAAVDGVDVLFFGPGDYSVLHGFPDEWEHPRIRQSMERIAEAAAAAGKHWGMPAGDLRNASELVEMGARFICYGVDLIWIRDALDAMQRDFGPLGFNFDNQMPASQESPVVG
jgi:4-hydroxy-2-oxoheptanedioate aldolase